MDTDDRQLLFASAKGDRDAFGLFVRRHTAPVLRFCLNRLRDRHAADDAVQETMMRMFKQTKDGGVPDEPSAWLFGIARMCCLEQTRQQKRHAGSLLEGEVAVATIDQYEVPSGILTQVEKLSESAQALLHMKHTRQMSCREIAKQTGQPVGTVTAQLSRAYAKLRQAVENEVAQ